MERWNPGMPVAWRHDGRWRRWLLQRERLVRFSDDDLRFLRIRHQQRLSQGIGTWVDGEECEAISWLLRERAGSTRAA